MKLDADFGTESLGALGVEAIDLLCRGDVNTLAQRFGYALSFDRDPATAIREDLKRCLSEAGATSLARAPENPVRSVKYFKPNSSNLIAVVECSAPTQTGAALSVDLIVSSKAEERHITLESIYWQG